MKKITAFRELELQLQLNKLEEEWEIAKQTYTDDGTVESADEILKISVEKIKVLSEIYMYTYEA